MSKYRNLIGVVVRGSVVALQTVAAVLIPAKFADAATRDDGAHKDAVASDEGLRFQLDARANEALARSETFVQVAQNNQGNNADNDDGGNPRSAEDVVNDSIQLLNSRGVNVGALLQAGALGNAVQQLIDNGDVAGADDGEGVDVDDVVDSLDTDSIQEIIASGS